MEASDNHKFTDFFWGKSGHENAESSEGFEVLNKRMHDAKSMGEAFEEFYRKKVEFEKSYGNAFMKLAGSISHRDNHGELKHCWDTLLAVTHSVGQTHLTVADVFENEYLPELKSFNNHQRRRRKIAEDSCHKTHEKRLKAYEKVSRTQKLYYTKCKEFEALDAQSQTEKNQGKLCKVKTAVDTLEIAYFEAVRSYNDIKQQWESDFTVLCEIYQELEEDRISFTKNTFMNIAEAGRHCAQETERIYKKLLDASNNIDVNEEIQLLIRNISTGTVRLKEIPSVDYCKLGSPRGIISEASGSVSNLNLYSLKSSSQSPNAVEYRALNDYTRQSEEELSFKAGSHVYVLLL
jgi:hypothetical protein